MPSSKTSPRSHCDRGYVVETGRFAASGSAAELLADNRVQVA
jgi:ABC-type branched-subunit amino acid transport system ATPase component